MSKHAFVAGPWTVEDAGGGPVVTAHDGLLSVAEIHDHSDTSDQHTTDEARANARLIAASPKLMSALELAVATIERLTAGCPAKAASVQGTLQVAGEALAEAGGEIK